MKFIKLMGEKLGVEVAYDAKETGIKSFVGGETLNKYSNVPKEL